MLNIAMYNIIQNHFTEIGAIKDYIIFMCISMGQ